MKTLIIDTLSGPLAARLWDRAGAAAPWLHFGHATGMHGGLYAARLETLADRFRILATDARGHGRTAALGNRAWMADWGDMASDLLQAIDVVDAQSRWILAGHSLGAIVAALAAERAPLRAQWLVMVEPAIMSFAVARVGGPACNAMADQAAARRPAFPDAAAAQASWAGRGVFANWSAADLESHIVDALLPGRPAVLACTPAYEAMTFRGWPRALEASLARLSVPFALIVAERFSTVADADFAALSAHPLCALAELVPGSDHFLPLSHWQHVATAIEAGPLQISMPSAAS